MMIKTKNTKGYTLLEILVVLLISSIVMIIAGSLILNSLEFFNKETRSDVDKYAVDNIASIVRDELMYASDVRITTQGDTEIDGDGWRSFSMQEHRLYLDDVLVFQNDFYNNRNLVMEATGNDDGFRMNLQFTFKHRSSGDAVYQTSETIEMLNLKERSKVDSNFHPFPISSSFEIGKNGYRLYYKKGDIPENSRSNIDDATGTVKDELNCRNEEVSEPGEISSNFKGEFRQSTSYKYGDFVSFSSNFYRCVNKDGLNTNAIINTPLAMKGWKKIDTNWADRSAYQTGDVIFFNYKPFKCLKGIDDFGDNEEKIVGGTSYYGTSKQPNEYDSSNIFWRLLSQKELEDERENANTKLCEVINWSVGGEKERCGNSGNTKIWKDSTLGEETYQIGDFVLFEGKWYRALAYVTNSSTGKPDTLIDWKIIETAWHKGNRYNKHDIVLFDGKYYRARAGYLTSIDKPGNSTKWDGGGDSSSAGPGYDNIEEIIKKIVDKEENYAYPSCNIE